MNIPELSKRAIAAHGAMEHFLSGVEEGVKDVRFKLQLCDHRKLRDLLEDIEIMAARAGAESKSLRNFPLMGIIRSRSWRSA